jgi:CheY-like chemotaxis protein
MGLIVEAAGIGDVCPTGAVPFRRHRFPDARDAGELFRSGSNQSTEPTCKLSDVAAASLILILSDINMPGMTGLELLPKAKATRPDVPVIMITAYGDADTERKALAGGADALLTKPIDFDALRNRIDSRLASAA